MGGLASGLEQAGAYVAKNGLCNDNGRCDFRKGRRLSVCQLSMRSFMRNQAIASQTHNALMLKSLHRLFRFRLDHIVGSGRLAGLDPASKSLAKPTGQNSIAPESLLA
jgi:hypothetical protein